MAKKGLKETVYEYLYEEIMSCRLKPNHAIIEQEISNVLGVSRTPVREALKQLELEGLVTQIPLRGAFVKDITTQDLEEVFELRILLETAALKTTIKSITNDEINALEKNFNALSYDSSEEEYYQSDRALHNGIMKYSGNTRMINIHKTIDSQLERFRRISSMTPDRLSKSRNEHMSILNALKARDLDLATLKLTQHLNNVKESTQMVCRSMRVGL